MSRRESRRVLVLAVVVVIVCALGWAWLRHALHTPTPEERTREKAAEILEKVRDLTR